MNNDIYPSLSYRSLRVVEFELYKLRGLRRFLIYMVLRLSYYSGSNFVDAKLITTRLQGHSA